MTRSTKKGTTKTSVQRQSWGIKPLLTLAFIASLALSSQSFAQHRSGGNSHRVTQNGLVPLDLPPVPGAVRGVVTGHANPGDKLNIVVSMPFGDPVGMKNFADQVNNPRSPYYRQFITPEEVGARFGLPQAKVDSVANYLTSKGMKVTLVAKSHLTVLAEGTVAQAESAFGTTINNYSETPTNSAEPANFYANETSIKMPANIAPYIVDVAGLDNYYRPMPRANTTLLNPTLTRALYNTAPIYNAGMHGENRTIAVTNFDGFRLSNAPLYINAFGLPVPPGGAGSNITVETFGGGSGSGAAGAEGDLDFQMELGMAPLASIIIYDGVGTVAGLTGILTMEANENKADVLSESYGWNISTATGTTAHNLHLTMSAQGQTYLAATGDSGTNLGSFSYPDDDPDVGQVGGTVATVDNVTGIRVSEVGWSGSGGGWSTRADSFNVLPSWQVGTGVPTGNNHRLLPDFSLHASGAGNSGAYRFYWNGAQQTGFIGTSFASPIFCGCVALAEQKMISQGGLPANGAGKQRMGRLQDMVYQQNGRTDVWFDITSGANGTLPNGQASVCTPKWDFVTGWGSVNFDNFVASIFPTLTSLSPSSAAAGGPAFTLTVNGSNFYSNSIVTWNGSNRTTTFVNSGQVTAAITAADIASAGSATVKVVNPGLATSNGLTFTITGGATTVNPASFTLFRGNLISGNLNSLFTIDTNYLRVQPGITLNAGEAPVQVILDAVSPTQTASALTFNLTSHVDVGNLQQNIELFDWVANAYVNVDSRLGSVNTDASVVANGSSPNRFIQSGTKAIRARVSYKSVGLNAHFPWNVFIDQSVWKITP